ncbi:hypothetical protein CEK26_010929 [Fusarium fujikuroi]|nr:uncharacterized protein LW93_5467 [Fusarium fujikuroi]KLO92697.1 uncharacterized protein Y057_12457 [Fusarium fujikuroi]KLP20091.1 uncharacterized protein LW94_4724 [Fusarium fujikuroi]QGI66974.1 hypothetical protein CEK27_010945 [Fusarium fujikuroi]QGI84211.1 hypothetical protein CEK25_010940 [Fusarium fujikuroi]
MMNQPKGAGRVGGIILKAFLFLFAITNFLTLILTAVTAGKHWGKQLDLFNKLLVYDDDSASFTLPNDLPPAVVFGLGRFMDDSARPYVFLAVLAGITWVITSITLLFLFTKIQYFNHRVARYVFRVIGVATSVFLVIFYLTWAHTYNFELPLAIGWPLGKASVIVAHINLLLGIFITLLAAVLDTPKDWDTPTGPNSRLTSQV